MVKKELGFGDDMVVLAGIAVGYEDETHKINHIQAERENFKKNADSIKD